MDDLAFYLTAVLTVLALLYYYLTWNYDFFTKMGVPGPRPIPVLGNALDLFRKSIHTCDTDWYNKYGRVFGIFEGSRPNLFIGDPEIIRVVTQKEFSKFVDRRTFDLSKIAPLMNKTLTNLKGDEWRATRSVVSPSFTTTRMKQMLPIMADCSKTFSNNCVELAEKGDVVEVKRMFDCVTMNVIASCGFGMQIESLKNPDEPFVKNARGLMGDKPPVLAFALLLMFPKLFPYFKIELINPTVLQFFADACGKLMKIREKESADNLKRKDFLQLMLDARKNDIIETSMEADGAHTTVEQEETRKYSAWKILDDEMILAQSVQLLLAGFETTATTLAFTTYALAANPDVQERLYEEIDGAVGKSDVTYELLAEAKMPYLDMVISETLRVYPPASRLERVCTEKFVYKNLVIPVDTLVSFPVYAIHLDPENYPDPTTFDPERFTQENKSKRHPLTHIPFGMGPRSCVGMRFALMEVKMVLVDVLRKIKFVTCSETKVPELTFASTIRAKNGLKLKLEKRA